MYKEYKMVSSNQNLEQHINSGVKICKNGLIHVEESPKGMRLGTRQFHAMSGQKMQCVEVLTLWCVNTNFNVYHQI